MTRSPPPTLLDASTARSTQLLLASDLDECPASGFLVAVVKYACHVWKGYVTTHTTKSIHTCVARLGRPGPVHMRASAYYPPTCHAAHVYPKTAAADALQAKDQKDGARARARRIEPALRGGLALSPIER